jgi:hypothetical protein
MQPRMNADQRRYGGSFGHDTLDALMPYPRSSVSIRGRIVPFTSRTLD